MGCELKIIFMKIQNLSLILLFVSSLFLGEIRAEKIETFAIGFYNLENLFDTINDPTLSKNDEFTPNGSNKWGTMKYNAKLKNMSYAISKIGVTKYTPDGVAILGVSEIENRSVLEDLVKQPSIADRNLQIVHHDGPDRRGVDCALLYNPKYFTVTSWKSIPFKISDKPNFRSRDQLLVTGILSGEEIHVIVNHWPSRYGGEVSSRPLRVAAAELSKSISDSLLAIDPNAKIIIMGDLNDDPTNVSCAEVLDAKRYISDVKKGGLYNTMWPIFAKGNGSLGYQDTWCLYDQIIVSYDWLGNDFSSLKFIKPEVFNKPFLTEQTGKRRGYPLRTHASGVWKNGYSDHFPTLIYVLKDVEEKNTSVKEDLAFIDNIVEFEETILPIDTFVHKIPEEIAETIKTIPQDEFTNFDKNKVVIKDESVVDKIANLLIENTQLYLELVGHTCDEGSEKYNLKLSEQRAESVKKMLVKRKVPSDRIIITAKGMSEPLYPNDTEENKSKNRRVDMIFTYK
jgi:outer membrane protein OmpA-like peptidoglycan-associated protein